MNQPLPQDYPYHRITLDRSKVFSTVHGERMADDPHVRVAAMQGGLPFDVNDHLVPDDGKTDRWVGIAADGKQVTYTPLYTAEMRAVALRRMERLRMGKPAEEEVERDVDPQKKTNDVDLINLSAWLKGEEDYKDQEIVDAVAARYSMKFPANVKGRQAAAHYLIYVHQPTLVHQQNCSGELIQLCAPLVEKGQ